jgi:hypothetical protein
LVAKLFYFIFVYIKINFMRKVICSICVLLVLKKGIAQNVGIGTNSPNANAVLDISSNSKGILIPRMDSTRRKNIPATNGMMVYDSTSKCFWYHNGISWVNMPQKGNATGDLLFWNGQAWTILPAGQGGQYLSLAAGSLLPTWATVTTGGGGASISLSTQNVSNVAPSTVTCGGSIVADGGAAITARGVVWNINPNPTTALSTKTLDGTGIGTFTSSLTGLTPATTYYARAYATNTNGTSYGNQVSFATVSNFTIGQAYGGGIIFYIDGTGQHGLIVSPEDLSTGITWDNPGQTNTPITNASGLAIGTGQANTNTIISAQGNGSYAAILCKNFYAGGGFTDWYLPSLYELNQLYLKRSLVGMVPPINQYIFYWSSSEVSQQSAWSVNFGEPGPNQNSDFKGNSSSVRAIRKF